MKSPCLLIGALCLLLTGIAFSQQPERKYFGKNHPFNETELPAGPLKEKLQNLPPQARGKAMKWLHEITFADFDAANHLRVDHNGGIYITCPITGCKGCGGDHHHHDPEHEEAAPLADPESAGGKAEDPDEEPQVAGTSLPISSPPVFNSKPGAPFHIYIDFNGAVVEGKQWNTSYGVTSWDCLPWGLDSDRTTFSVSEQDAIRRIWERIAEDYAPFNINVTTDVTYDPVNYTGDKNKVGWLLITPTKDAANVALPHDGYGGVAYVGVFGNSTYFSAHQPAFVTPMGTANTAEAASHEMGHNMGLSHDGLTTGAAYYGGHAATSSAPSWGPIMGTGYNRNVSQWSKGEYFNGNQPQDDLAIIANRTAFRADDHGSTFGTATPLLASPVNQPGVIERTNVPDFFTFNTGAGTISFNANTYRCDTETWGGNLDILLELYDESQTLIASHNPPADVNASITTSVPAGRYYLVVRPTGAGTPLVSPPSGYTIYGSVGRYTITGNFIPEDGIFISSPGGGETWIAGLTYPITWGSAMAGNVKIELFKGGALHTTITAGTPNNGSYSWTIPSGITIGNDYKVRITSVESSTKSHESLSNFTITTDPLAEALDTTGLIWTTSGNLPWFYQTTTTKDGLDAAQSGAITHSQTSSLETTLVGPGTMTFWWKVSSESNYDFLRFFLNGVEQTGSLARISGNVDWVQKTVNIPTGNHTVRWSYTKDGSVSSNADTAWVDQVVFTPASAPLIVVEQPAGTGLTDGASTVDFGSVNVESPAERTFTIRNDGTADLTGLALSKSGTHSEDYDHGSLSTATLAPGASTTFTVTFTPGAAGTRTAALQIASNDTVRNPFDINLTGNGLGPGTLVVTDSDGLTSSGNIGGPFSPTSIQYTLSNPGGTSINWSAGNIANWLTLSSPSGTLASGANTTVTVSINSNANSLTAGNYNDTVTFTSNTTGSTTRAVALRVNTPPVVNAGPDQTVYLAATTPPEGWSHSAWTGDADSGISDEFTYTAAHCFGDNHASVTVNNVTFSEGFASSGTGWSVGGAITNWQGDDDAQISGSSEDLAEEFIYNGNPRTVTFSGLTPGQGYEAVFYSVGWEASGRFQTFSTPGITSLYVDQDHYGNNKGIKISCTYVPSETSKEFTITPASGNTFHLYAMLNRQINTDAATATLEGTATDPDGDPVTSIWTVVSGPGPVSFGNVNAIDTTANFTMVGVYTLRLTANDGITQVSDDVVITVEPAHSGFTVRYNGNGSTGGTVPVDGANYDENATVTVLGNTGSLVRAGYTFADWNTSANGSSTAYQPGNTFNINTNVNLYAQWTANTYNVTFNANGGTTPSPTGKSVTFDSAYGTLATTSRTGYTLSGWFTAASGGTEVTDATIVATASNHTLFAQWTPNTYTVTFNANGGDTPSPASKSVTFNSTYGTLATVTRTGYTFTGWFTAASDGNLVTESTTVTATANHTLYAQWTPTIYTVSYDANNATSGTAPSSQTKAFGENLTLATNNGNLVRTGYTFSGWNTSADGSETNYSAGGVYSANADAVLYARWTAITYTVTFNANGGETPVPSSKLVTFGASYEDLANTTRADHNLNGWFTAAAGGSLVTTGTPVTIAADHTLYAQWTKLSVEMEVLRNGTAIAVNGYDMVQESTTGTGAKLNYDIFNGGTDNLLLDGAVISAMNHCTVDIDSQPASSVAPSSITSLVLTATPTAAGAWSFTVSIPSNDSDKNPYQWTVHGVAASATTVVFTPVADTYIISTSAGSNYGSESVISLNNQTSGGPAASRAVVRGLLRFDLSSIPANTIIDSATLDFVQDNGNSGLINIVEATGSWGETTANWTNSSGIYGSTSFDSVSTGNTAGAAVPTITLNAAGLSKVQSWVNTPSGNHGFGITTTNNGKNSNEWLALRSREHATEAHRPRLTLSYSADPQVAEIHVTRDGAVVADGGADSVSGTLAGTGVQLTYQIANLGNANLTLTTPVSVSAASNCAVTVNTQPANTVVPSTSTNLVLTVTPTAGGAWSTNVSITNNDPDENPYNWTISGTAAGSDPYTTWSNNNFDEPEVDSNPDADPDGDGLTNLQEFAFDMDPLVSRLGPITFVSGGEVTQTGIPMIMDFAAAQGNPPFRAVFGRRKNHVAAGLTYTVDFSADLATWTANGGAPVVLSGLENSSDVEAVGVDFPATVPTASSGNLPPKFFRVGVSME